LNQSGLDAVLMVVTDGGSDREVSDVQPRKTSLLMLCINAGNDTEASDVQHWKAP